MTEPPRPNDRDSIDELLRGIVERSAGTGTDAPRERLPRRVRWALLGAGAAFVLLLFVPAVARRVTDWMWYREIGFERVFLTKIVAQWILGGIAGVIAFVIFYGNVRLALRSQTTAVMAATSEPRRRPTTLPERFARVLALPGTAVLALLFALGAATEWRTLLQFLYRTPFGTADPIFGRDIGYYVFVLPLLEAILGYAVLAGMLTLACVWAVYSVRGAIRRREWRVRLEPSARRHLTILAALLLVVFAAQIPLIAIPHLLYSVHSSLVGANYTDLHARLPAWWAVSGLMLFAGAYLLWRAWKGRLTRSAAIVVAGTIVLALLIGRAYPATFQRLVVQPNELTREAPQIVRHIEATRAAWGLAGVERRELEGGSALTQRDIDANRATIANVRLWDREPLLQTFGQIQSIRTYYDFVAVDDDRYRIGGELRQVMLSARELNTAALPTRTFINEHLTFTHGMGITLGPSNQVTAEGLPVLFIQDLPPVSRIDVKVSRPQIYFGELSNDFILAPSRQREFDYPAGEGDEAVYSSYDGTAGVPVASFARRLLFAWRFGSLNILLSRDLTERTRIIYHRDVRERARRALPFLTLDRDPYLVIADDGTLKWMLDAYTMTARYPYSQRATDGTNYMRNSVKIVIDAYNGDVRAYQTDDTDPIIRTLARIYPGLLQPIAQMPADLRAHVRYPEDLFRMQTALYATYHMSDPQTFYHREDQWQVPGSSRGDQAEAFLRHMVMRLPGEREPEFILMRPFTPRQKDNLAAWMVARNDGEQYGRLLVYQFPRQSLVFGPTQIVNRINQDTEVARQISLWDQRGSEVIRGELLVIPIEESLIYVQPLYLRAEGGRIPELKRVIVAHESRVVMEESLEAGLARLFGGEGQLLAQRDAAEPTPTRSTAPASAIGEVVRRAVSHYERARAAQRADDWATYGEEMRLLGETLRQIQGEGDSRP
ncbi:MAG TPA: UPF0182 family protein [Gemmatimonadaceae bacterium]|nr:UPF0182 family protein [Gemmatimonadaceae bacterium]